MEHDLRPSRRCGLVARCFAVRAMHAQRGVRSTSHTAYVIATSLLAARGTERPQRALHFAPHRHFPVRRSRNGEATGWSALLFAYRLRHRFPVRRSGTERPQRALHFAHRPESSSLPCSPFVKCRGHSVECVRRFTSRHRRSRNTEATEWSSLHFELCRSPLRGWCTSRPVGSRELSRSLRGSSLVDPRSDRSRELPSAPGACSTLQTELVSAP